MVRCCESIAVLVALACLVVGCAEQNAGESLGATVEGKVTLKGSPVEGATITFQPVNSALKGGFGRTNAEGIYTLSASSTAVGVPPGDYTVTVTKIEVPKSTAPAEGEPGYTGKEAPSQPVKNLLPEKYGKPETSGLKVTVKPGENQVPLDLTP